MKNEEKKINQHTYKHHKIMTPQGTANEKGMYM